MGRSYSLDLRQRLLARAAAGQSRRAAAEDLAVSASFSVKLVAGHERPGSLEPKPQSAPSGEHYRAFPDGEGQGKARHHDA